jgi:hypothetical protein
MLRLLAAPEPAWSLDQARTWSLGAYVNPGNTPLTTEEALTASTHLEAQIGQPLELVSTFVAWEEPFPNAAHVLHRKAGRTPLIAWYTDGDLQGITTGAWDSLVRERARSCRELGGPILVRWAAEFNAEHNACYGRPRAFASAWRRLVSLFRAEGATNVRWVWCPLAVDRTRSAANDWRRYYPGDRFVDLVGMDGYNWGTARAWSRWQTFGELFGPLYADYAARKRLVICEVASAEMGGNKPAWIRDMGAMLRRRLPRVRAVAWFHTNKETDWRIDSSPAALAAFRTIASGRRAR